MLVQQVLAKDVFSDSQNQIALNLSTFVFDIAFGFILYNIAYRKIWARNILALCVILETWFFANALFPLDLPSTSPNNQMPVFLTIVLVLQSVLQVAGVLCLYTKNSRNWFEKKSTDFS